MRRATAVVSSQEGCRKVATHTLLSVGSSFSGIIIVLCIHTSTYESCCAYIVYNRRLPFRGMKAAEHLHACIRCLLLSNGESCRYMCVMLVPVHEYEYLSGVLGFPTYVRNCSMVTATIDIQYWWLLVCFCGMLHGAQR